MSPSMRRFVVQKGRTVTLPAAMTEGTDNARLDPESTVDLEASRCEPFGRFLANRVKLGDLVEVTYTEPPNAPPAPASSPTAAPAAPVKE